MGTRPASLPTMVVAQRQPMSSRITGEGTVHSYNSSQLSCFKEYEGTEGTDWTLAVHQNNGVCSSHDRQSQDNTNPNATVITQSPWNKNTSLHQAPQPMGISEWNNDTQQDTEYTDHSEIDMNNFAQVSLWTNSNNIPVHILTFGGPPG